MRLTIVGFGLALAGASACGGSTPPKANEAPAASAAATVVATPQAPRSKLETPSNSGLGALLNAGADDSKQASSKPSLWEKPAPENARGPVALSDADRQAIAKVLCESAPPKPGGGGFKCAPCPSYTEFKGDTTGMTLTRFFPGHFSGPGREEVVVATTGCESGAGSSQSYGGRAVVRKMAEGWQRTFYQAGALGDCTPILSRAGRSRLVCHLASGHQGEYPQTFTLRSFDEAEGRAEERPEEIFEFTTRDVTVLRNFTKEPLSVLQLKRFNVIGKDKYEAGDERALAMEVTIHSSVDCVGGAKGCPGVDTRAFDVSLRWVFDGAAFHLAPESQAALDRLKPRNEE